ncbi:MAG: hypothetical protein PVJ67_00690 [Candidatus Pacearchaeota archaeon]|jgi:hypothetical protein
MKPKTLRIITRILILLLFVVLVGVLTYSLFYLKEINCNARLEFTKIENCTYECQRDCVNDGFSTEANHSFRGEKVYVVKDGDIVKKEVKCLCECLGCRD